MSCCHRSPCPPFTPPVNPDQGQCFPLPEVRDCEAPAQPPVPCNETIGPNDAHAVYDPAATPPFRVFTHLYDEACDPISDETPDMITTLII